MKAFEYVGLGKISTKIQTSKRYGKATFLKTYI